MSLSTSDVPEKLRNIPQPPRCLFVLGADLKTLLEKPCVAIIGSRKVSTYGRTVTYMLASEVAKKGVVVISGLALGVDSIAHRATLEAGGQTIAVLPTAPDRMYPAIHQNLADQIVQQGGALVNEYPRGQPNLQNAFHRA